MTKPYHHGDLRRALLESAWAILDEFGLEAVSLRAVARRAGVSHAAPGHHFAGKGDLVEAMAVQGFEWFAADLQRAWDEATADGSDPVTALSTVGRAYVRFARNRPHVFALLNRPELRRTRPDSADPVERAAEGSYLVLVRGVRAAQEAGQITPGSPEPWALLAWAGVHGLAMMLTDGLIDASGHPGEEELTSTLLLALAHGLLARPPAISGDGDPRSRQ